MAIKNVAVLIFVIVLLVAGYWARIGVDTNHDGISLKPALDVVWGKVLYRDTFTHYGSLTAYTHAGAMRLFGEKLVVIKMAVAVAYGLTGVMVWWLGYKLTNKKTALIGVMLWLLMASYYYQHYYAWASVYGALIHLITVCWLWVTIDRNLRTSDVFTLGILAGVAFWFKQPYLMTIIAVTLIFWIWGWQKKLPMLILGFGLVGIVVLGTIYFSGGLLDFLKQNIWVGYINGRILADDNTWWETINYFWRRPLWLILALESLWVNWKLKKNKYLPVIILATSSLVHYLPLLDDSHMYWAATPVFAVWVYSLRQLWKERKKIIYLAIVIITLIFVTGEITMRIKVGSERVINNSVEIEKPEVLQGMKTDIKMAENLINFDKVINIYLSEHVDKKMVSMSMDSLYMTFSREAQNIETLYCDLSSLASGVYPYQIALDNYIDLHKPLVLTDGGQKIPMGYIKIGEWNYLNKVLLAPESSW